jgi:hypothetical protein
MDQMRKERCRRWEKIMGESEHLEIPRLELFDSLEREHYYDDTQLVSSTHLASADVAQEQHRRDLQHLHEALKLLPLHEKLEYEFVSAQSPCLVRYESPPILFVIREEYDHFAAARRLCKYWKTRIKVFEEPESPGKSPTHAGESLLTSRGYRPLMLHPCHRQRTNTASCDYFFCQCLHPHCRHDSDSSCDRESTQDTGIRREAVGNIACHLSEDALDRFYALDANDRRVLATGWLSILPTFDYGSINMGDQSYYSLPVLHFDRTALSPDAFPWARRLLNLSQQKSRLIVWFATQLAVRYAPHVQVDGFRFLARVIDSFSAGFSSSIGLSVVHQIQEVFAIRLYRIDVYAVPPKKSSTARAFFLSTLLRIIFSKLPTFLRWKAQLQTCDTVDDMRQRLLAPVGAGGTDRHNILGLKHSVTDPRDTQRLFSSVKLLPIKFGGEWDVSAICPGTGQMNHEKLVRLMQIVKTIGPSDDCSQSRSRRGFESTRQRGVTGVLDSQLPAPHRLTDSPLPLPVNAELKTMRKRARRL